MNRTPKSKPLSWTQWAVMALVFGLLFYVLAAGSWSPVRILASVGFGVVMLPMAWLWQLTLRRAETVLPQSRREWARQVLVFVAWLAVLAVLVWWYVANRAERIQPPELPALVADHPEPPPVNRDTGP